ncbi:LCP family protein required for cell wall assembly [Kitasatospora sp. MAP12-15]|uniref:LCP family protein n=1 Tax=unclassified Kitasatospora TaxID=2633591 RepID=UPI002476876F|nr:LCP family protein [Kitasatospora sp. MAP12-44]MDH6108515.1 LCP family protein required for cell wall assembly [Kitasatospora sp. MAP12-44]
MRTSQPKEPLPPQDRAAKRRRHLRHVVVSLVAVLLGLLMIGVGTVEWGTNHYAGEVQRIPNALPNLPADQRPVKPPEAGKSLTFLLVGLDARSDLPTTGNAAGAPLWTYGAQRTDTIMLLHLTSDRHQAYLVSIPRDTWVPIPGHGEAKINAAFSWGGPPLLIQTVEQYTGIRIDHFGAIDWSGFTSLTNAVGGVTITIPGNSYDPEQNRHWTAGTTTMDGATALAYVRQRYGLPNGDLDRIARQQNFLRALMTKVAGQISLTDPFGLSRLMDATAKAVSVDSQLSNSELRDLALGMRNLGSGNVTFVEPPLGGFMTVDGQDALSLDATKAPALWKAVSTDRLSSWIAQYGTGNLLPSTVK